MLESFIAKWNVKRLLIEGIPEGEQISGILEAGEPVFGRSVNPISTVGRGWDTLCSPNYYIRASTDFQTLQHP